MSKPVSKAKKKKARVAEITEVVKPQSAKKFERAVTAFIGELDETSQKREDWVQSILAVNDESIDEIVDAMCDSLYRMAIGNATPEVFIVYKDQKVRPRNDAERDLIIEIQNRNRRWVAVRILVASAEQDIQIGNFKVLAGKCVRCGKKAVKVKPVKVAKKKISKPSKKVKK